MVLVWIVCGVREFERWMITCFVDVTLLWKFGIQFLNGSEQRSLYLEMWFPS